MKKVILGIALIGSGAFLTAPANAQDAPVPQSVQQAELVIPTPPQFESAEANRSIGELVDLLETYVPAIRASDTAKIVEFSSKVQAWQQSAASWVTTLTPADKEKLDAYMKQVDATLQGEPADAIEEVAPGVQPEGTDTEE